MWQSITSVKQIFSTRRSCCVSKEHCYGEGKSVQKWIHQKKARKGQKEKSRWVPAADGCHPSITIGTKSSKLMRYNSVNALQRDISRGAATDGTGDTMVTMPSISKTNRFHAGFF